MSIRVRIRLRWFLYYLGVLSLPFVVGILVFFQGSRIINRESQNLEQARLNIFANSFDAVLKDIRLLETTIIQDRELRSLVSGDFPDGQENLLAWQLIEKYGPTLFSSADIEWILYNSVTNKVLTRETYTSDLNYLGDRLGSSPQQNLAGWRLRMSKLRQGGLHRIPSISWRGNPQDDELVYSRALRVGSQMPEPPVLAFVLSASDLTRLFSGIFSGAHQSLYVRTADTMFLLAGNRTVEDSWHSTGHRAFSQLLPLEFILYGTENDDLGGLKTHQLYSVIAFVVCLGLALLASVYFIKRQYSPVQHLMGLVLSTRYSKVDVESNEYKIIENALSRAIDDTTELRELMEGQERALELFNFTSLLKGEAPQLEFSSQAFLANLSVISYFVVAIDPIDTTDRRLPVAMAEESLSSDYTVISSLVEGRSLYITVGTKGGADGIADSIQSFFLEVRKSAGDTVAVAMSAEHPVDTPPHVVLEEARDALSYRLVDGTTGVLSSDVLQSNRTTFAFSLNQENELINRIIAGDRDAALSITNEILALNFQERSLSIEMGRCLVFALATTIVRAVNRVAQLRESHYWDEIKPIQRVESCKTYEELKNASIELVDTVCATIGENRQTHRDRLLDQVKAHIEENISDPNLGTKSIADHFDMNPAYLARVFKDYHNQTFSDYINVERINRAKALMLSTDLPITAIAQDLGYLESSSFIRAFKKFEGITPGGFRVSSDNSNG